MTAEISQMTDKAEAEVLARPIDLPCGLQLPNRLVKVRKALPS